MNFKTSLFAAAAAATLAAPAAASVTIYTDEAAFNAAAGATVTEDFDDAMLVSGLTIDSDAGEIDNGLFEDRLVPGGAETTFLFANPTTSFGGIFDLSPGGQGVGILIDLMPGGTLSTEVPETFTGQFFGFVSTTAFNSVTFSGGTQGGSAETYNLNNLQFGAVPEPGTWLMMILGFGAIGFSMRSRNSVRTSVSYS